MDVYTKVLGEVVNYLPPRIRVIQQYYHERHNDEHELRVNLKNRCFTYISVRVASKSDPYR